MHEDTTFVGMDTSSRKHQVAMLLPGSREVVAWDVASDRKSIERLIRRLKREARGRLEVCYEAGPCGFDLQRQMEGAGVRCMVVAPSLVPVKPGDRVKTNRRDAQKLASYLRAGTLTPVRVPQAAEEAVRDLCRCREQAVEDQMRARHRLSKFMLRRGYRWPQRAWTKGYWAWVRTLRFAEASDQVVFESYVLEVEHVEERVRGLTVALEEASQRDPYREPVGWLRCLRGFDTVTAMTVVAELYGVERFEGPRSLMAYLGLVPSEYSTGDRSRRGAITKAGNRHVRRVLIEASWHYARRPALSKALRRRREGQPAWAVGIADTAMSRLHRRYWHLVKSRKAPNVAVTAVARELAGFVWAMLQRGSARTRPAEEGQS
jgi:transposase